MTNIMPKSRIYVQQTPFFLGAYDRQIATDINLTGSFLAKYGVLPSIGDRVGVRVVYLNKFAGQIITFPVQPVTVS